MAAYELHRGYILLDQGWMWLYRGFIWLQRGYILLHRGCITVAFGCIGAAFGWIYTYCRICCRLLAGHRDPGAESTWSEGGKMSVPGRW